VKGFYDCDCGNSYLARANDECPECGALTLRNRALRFVDVRPSAHKCDVRCTSARGTLCRCACGGKNHGIGESHSPTRASACDEILATPPKNLGELLEQIKSVEAEWQLKTR
jgi:hypothetical protein